MLAPVIPQPAAPHTQPAPEQEKLPLRSLLLAGAALAPPTPHIPPVIPDVAAPEAERPLAKILARAGPES